MDSLEEKERDELGENGVDDMVNLVDLNEASLLSNIKTRYDKQLIYTFAGNILMAVNPYKQLNIYGLDVVKKYEGQILGTLPPHLFAVGSSAYSRMTKDNEDQVIIISGESGSGKTETTKLFMQYLAAVNKSASNIVTEQILEASPMLESFGNAKTVKNNNSSRFGKYLEIHFKDGLITGAKTTEYLLEKSRIVTHALDERNYHVFYELLAGLSDQEKEKYGLQAADKYFYLNQGGSCEIDGKNDEEGFRFLLSAMQVLGFTHEEQDVIFRILASVLHLGNVYFHRKQLKHGQEGVEIGSDTEVRWTSHLLQVPLEGILRAISFRTTEARNERMLTPLNIDQALDARDAVAKALYASLFTWLVRRVNSIIHKATGRRATFALLDIFGFEEFKENSFEQLCINFANETLHSYFNKYIFKLEQQEYSKEKIDWQMLPCPDNQAVLNLISKKPEGILALLDDESNFPKATDASFLEKCHFNNALNEHYSRPRMSSMEFGIKHFAGQVWYSVDGFLDKNRDTLRPEVLELLVNSKIDMISKIFGDLRSSTEVVKTCNRSDGRFITMKPRAPTVATRFQDSLQSLVDTMSKSNPWFVRCIKPNKEKAPLKLDTAVVLEQLRYTGMLETVRIRQVGYPIRMKFHHFAARYRCLLQGHLARTSTKDLCKKIFDTIPLSNSQYQLGSSKVFMRESLEHTLEKERVRILRGAVVTVQKYFRGYLARKRLRTRNSAATTIQSAFRRHQARSRYVTLRRGIIRAQASWKMRSQRREYQKIKAVLTRKQEAERVAREQAMAKHQHQAKKELDRSRSNAAAIDRQLEVPVQLASVFAKLEEWRAPQDENNVVKASSQLSLRLKTRLPSDIDQFAFKKFTDVYFRSHVWACKREPIKTPFLAKSSDADVQESISLFQLVMRYMNDTRLTGRREKALADYIIQKGLKSESLRDEIYCQLCNQTWKNDNEQSVERGWQLMASCLSAFPPSHLLFKYLLKYVSDHAYDGYVGVCQQKLLRNERIEPQNARTYPPTLLEYKTSQKKSNMALQAKFADDERIYGALDSWTTGDEFSADLLSQRGIESKFGWTVELLDDGDFYELNGNDYVMDLISETEIVPTFPASQSYFLISPDRSRQRSVGQSCHDPEMYRTLDVEADNDELPPLKHGYNGQSSSSAYPEARPRAIESLATMSQSESVMSLDRTNMNLVKGSKLNQRYMRVAEDGENGGQSNGGDNANLNMKLSETSRLNKRYISNNKEKVPRKVEPHVMPLSKRSLSLQELGLATSALNERYFHSRQDLHKAVSVTSKADMMDGGLKNSALKKANDFLEEEEPPAMPLQKNKFANSGGQGGPMRSSSRSSSSTISSEMSTGGDNGRNGDQSQEPGQKSTENLSRYIKYSGKGPAKFPSYSQSTKAYIDKGRDDGFYPHGPRSSAMSDTSEAPSLASHVKNIKIPSHTSDLDQYLDDLFNPVLDGNLDELSDARSLAASIKGGGREADEPNCSFNREDASWHRQSGQMRGTAILDDLKLDDLEFHGLLSPESLAVTLCGGGQNELNAQTQSTITFGTSSSNTPTRQTPVERSASTDSSLSGQKPGQSPPSANTSNMPFTNVAGMTVPMVDTSQIIQQQLVHQQMIQRAFLASAVQQNLQIQQQLLQQNQALQQLLQTGPTSPDGGNGAVETGPNFPNMSPFGSLLQTDPGLQGMGSDLLGISASPFPPPSTPVSMRSYSGKTPDGSRGKFGPPVAPKSSSGSLLDISQDSRLAGQTRSLNVPPPPPPPPPSPPPVSPSGAFQDHYGRAKTVRIGKWRWPPPRDLDTGDAPAANSFFEFKMKKQHEKQQDVKATDDDPSGPVEKLQQQHQQQPLCQAQSHQERKISSASSPSSSEERESISIISNGTKHPVTAAPGSSKPLIRPLSVSNLDSKLAADNVGKLRISSEMKAKLEQLTIDQSVRGPGKKEGREKLARSMDDITQGGVKKLSENRKALLERQLMGSLRVVGNVMPLSDMPLPRRAESKENVGAVKASPVVPKHQQQQQQQQQLPDDGLIKIEGRFAPNRRSGSREIRERRDELGPHNTNHHHHRGHGPGTIASTVKAECGDHMGHSMANVSNFFDDLSTRNGSLYEESIASSARKECDFSIRGESQPQKVIRRMSVPPPPPPGDGESRRPPAKGQRHSQPQPAPSVAPSSTYYAPSTPLVARKKDIPQQQSYMDGGKSASQSELRSYAGHKLSKGDQFFSAVDVNRPAKMPRNSERIADYGPLKTKVYAINQSCLTYSKVSWDLRVRKEVFSPSEKIDNPTTLHLIFCQVVKDAHCHQLIRLNRQEKEKLQAQLANYSITVDNMHSPAHKLPVQRNIVDFAKELPTYFCRLYPVSGGRHLPNVNLLGISHSGVRLIRRERDARCDFLKVIDTLSFDDITDITVQRRSTVQLLLKSGGWITLFTPKANQVCCLIERFSMEAINSDAEFVRAIDDHLTRDTSLLSFRKGDVIRIIKNRNANVAPGWLFGVLESGEGGIFPSDTVVPLNKQEVRMLIEQMDDNKKNSSKYHQNGSSRRLGSGGDMGSQGSYSSADEEIQESSCWIESKSDAGMDDAKSDVTQSSQPQDGKFSLLQFALFNFKEALEKYELVRNQDGSVNESTNFLESLRAKKKKKKIGGDGSDWTWRELSDLVKYNSAPIQTSLLKLNSAELSKLAVDCFIAVMRYMGDYPMAKAQTEVDCVYTVLVNCHRYPQLRDEVYCQVIKQTTNNKSPRTDSCCRGWRLFSIIAAYFDCSENLRPYLIKHLETAAYDKRRAYHATALLCLTNLRKTLKYSGRKNVPSIEEIAAISAGRNSKRQMYRLPGGTERIINTTSTTIVQDVIEEICAMLSVRDPPEREEFSLYCIVEGDPYTMPLNKEEYILDVTTELLKNGQTFYLIFCRSVWVYPLRLDNSLYIEVIFNQVAPDYLEGLLLVTPGDRLPEESVGDVARIAALLHRAADMDHTPTRDEVKFLLPKPVLPMREIRPPQWVEMVQKNWVDMSALTTTEAKAQCLDILQKWPLFGSCFFAVKRIQSDSTSHVDNILALNRDGVHFLHPISHENIWRYPYSEVISTRKVRAEDGTLFLDMKCGNLMVQKITRIQTDQAHEISRLIRQYIDIQNSGKGETPPNIVTLSRINGPPSQPVFSN